MRKIPRSGGGWQAIRYTFRKAREVGGLRKMYRALRSKNACKTCALGMGGQRGGMVNELVQIVIEVVECVLLDVAGQFPHRVVVVPECILADLPTRLVLGLRRVADKLLKLHIRCRSVGARGANPAY